MLVLRSALALIRLINVLMVRAFGWLARPASSNAVRCPRSLLATVLSAAAPARATQQ